MTDCAFCTEFAMPIEDTWLVAREDNRVVLPAIGAFTEGYVLYMPADHALAFTDLGKEGLVDAEHDLELLRTRLTAQYGPVIIAEHGPRTCDFGAGCCDHAHMHLIPVPDPDQVLARYRDQGGAGREESSLATCLADVDEAYVYLSPRPGTHLVWPASPFLRQWVRRVCGAIHGVPDQWDWRDHPFEPARVRTYRQLRDQRLLSPETAL